MNVIKRSGEEVVFDSAKIRNAVAKFYDRLEDKCIFTIHKLKSYHF